MAKRGKVTRRARAKGGRPAGRSAPELNHVMVYSSDVPRALAFYRDLLGFKVIEEMDGYARIRAPKGSSTIGLHTIHAEEGRTMNTSTEGLRLYFEVGDLDRFCASLAAKGVKFDRMPQDMPWGWRHAYLKDPDGHELSLYRAGNRRFRKSF